MPVSQWKRGRLLSKIEKRPGPDWVVEVLVVSENEVYPVTIFGAIDQAEAERDALASFSSNAPADLRVISVTRDDEVGD